MKIVLGVGSTDFVGKEKDPTLADVKSTSTNYAFNLGREFRSRGIEVEYYYVRNETRRAGQEAPDELEISKYYKECPPPPSDHFICLEQSGFVLRHPLFFESTRIRCSGKVATICDHDGRIGSEDLVFHARLGQSGSEKAAYVGWGADKELFSPHQEENILNIFIDHKYYSNPKHDSTEDLIEQCCAFARQATPDQLGRGKASIRLTFLGPTGIEILDPTLVERREFGTDRSKYTKRISLSELATVYRKSDIFVVTHQESMGLPVLEAAMCGALVLSRQGYVEPELLRALHHLEYSGEIPLSEAVHMLDVKASRTRAALFDWSLVADRMLERLNEKVGRSVASLKISGASVPLPLVGEGNRFPWRSVGLRTLAAKQVSSSAHSSAPTVLQETEEEGYHFLYTKIPKDPWPIDYTLTVDVEDTSQIEMQISLFGAMHLDCTCLSLSFGTSLAASVNSRWLWEMRGYCIDRTKEGLWRVQLTVRSDYAPVLGVGLYTLNKGHEWFRGRPKREVMINSICLSPV